MLSAQALSDQVEIAQLVQRYGKALDEKDYALLDSVFTPDAVTNYELDGDEATAETRLIAAHGLERKSGEKSAWFVVGFYRDTLLRTPAGWRIRERCFQGLHTIGELPPAQELARFDKPFWHEEKC